MLRPPSLMGRANSLLSRLPGDVDPVRVGINLVLIKASKGPKSWQTLGVVQHKNNQRLIP